MEERIRKKLTEEFSPATLEILNESIHHDRAPGSETHFQVFLVSSRFEGMGRLARHRLVYGLLADEMKDSVHMLAVRALTPAEQKISGETSFRSPRHSD